MANTIQYLVSPCLMFAPCLFILHYTICIEYNCVRSKKKKNILLWNSFYSELLIKHYEAWPFYTASVGMNWFINTANNSPSEWLLAQATDSLSDSVHSFIRMKYRFKQVLMSSKLHQCGLECISKKNEHKGRQTVAILRHADINLLIQSKPVIWINIRFKHTHQSQAQGAMLLHNEQPFTYYVNSIQVDILYLYPIYKYSLTIYRM